MTALAITVIIPTHNRWASLQRTLKALEQQTSPLGSVQVVVVANGCTDATVPSLRSYPAPFMLHLLDLPAVGPAAARNAGANAAEGSLLVFLDDDIEALPGFLAAHAAAHAGSEELAVIGYLPTVLNGQKGYFHTELRGWWEAMFSPMREAGYRSRYTNLLTGNFSIPAALFRRLGGFDPNFQVHEDYEFGLRLIKAGVPLRFAPEAAGYHYDITHLKRSQQRKRDEGRADVQLARKHPELLPALQSCMLFGFGRPLWRAFFRLAFDRPALGDFISRGLVAGMTVLEWVRLQGRWRKLLEKLLVYWYLRGVAESIGSYRDWEKYVRASCTQAPDGIRELVLDLDGSVEAAEKILDEQRPDTATICYHGKIIGKLDPCPGCEPLRGAHLRPILTGDLAWPLFQAAVSEELDPSTLRGRLMARMVEKLASEHSK